MKSFTITLAAVFALAGCQGRESRQDSDGPGLLGAGEPKPLPVGLMFSASQSLTAGESRDISIEIIRGSVDKTLHVRCEDLPTGVTFVASAVPPREIFAHATLSASADAVPVEDRQVIVFVESDDGSVLSSGTFRLTVKAGTEGP